MEFEKIIELIDNSFICSNVIIPTIVSALFWYISFSLTTVKIVFSDCLVRIPADKNGQSSYYYRYSNIGSRDFIEASIVAKIYIKNQGRCKNSYLSASDNDVIPIIYKKGSKYNEAPRQIKWVKWD